MYFRLMVPDPHAVDHYRSLGHLLLGRTKTTITYISSVLFILESESFFYCEKWSDYLFDPSMTGALSKGFFINVTTYSVLSLCCNGVNIQSKQKYWWWWYAVLSSKDNYFMTVNHQSHTIIFTFIYYIKQFPKLLWPFLLWVFFSLQTLYFWPCD